MYKEKKGVSVVDAEIGLDGHLHTTLSNGVTVDAGSLNPDDMSQGEGGYGKQETHGNGGDYVVSVEKGLDGHLLLILSNGTILDAGLLPVPEPIYKIMYKVGGRRGGAWILVQGTWNDFLQWVDSALWKDS
jgi:hypothetical protein